MTNELELTQERMNHVLNDSLENASEIITKDYLSKLEHYRILEPSEEDLDIDISKCGKLYRLTKFVINREENFLDKLTTIINVVSCINCSIVTIVKSDGRTNEFYFGILSKNARTDEQRSEDAAAAFKGAILGNLVGSDLQQLSEEETTSFRKQIFEKENNCYSSISGIVGLRDDKSKAIDHYVQGLENLVDSLKGMEYTILMVADPVSTSQLRVVKQGYEILYTQLSAFAGNSVTINESDTLSLAKARTNGISEGISEGIAMTQSRTKSKGTQFGINTTAGISVPVTLLFGMNAGFNRSTADAMGKTHSTTQSTQTSSSVTDTSSSAKMEGKSLQISYKNRTVKALLDKINEYLQRLDKCESFGAFDCAAYVIADKRETALTVSSNYNALMRGENSGIQASHINLFYKSEQAKLIGKYLGSFVHPRFIQSEDKDVIVTPASIISGNELAIQIGLPKKSIPGITVIPMAPFGRNIIDKPDNKLELGALYHMGHEEGIGRKVKLDIKSLSMHTFITGSTGSGKSNTVYEMVRQLDHLGMNYLVIEPAKGEYKNIFGFYSDVRVYGTNPQYTELLRINPFRFPKGIHILEHIDRLIEIFNVCWPMYAAMPAVLKDAVLQAYESCGWDLSESKNKYSDELFPTFGDLVCELENVIQSSAYSDEVKGNYTGSLVTRIRSLTNGLNGQIFAASEIDSSELFDRKVIIDISRVGSTETKSLIMGILIMRLNEHRMALCKEMNVPLHHVTVLEEAHNILKRTSVEQNPEGSNVAGKSVEMISNAIAEMRTYGEGFIIADQSPGAVDISVIRNTNTKIIMRLPDEQDRRLAGKSAGLKDNQLDEIAKLPKGVAVVYQNDWLEPVLCKIGRFKGEERLYKKSPGLSHRSCGNTRKILIQNLLHKTAGEPLDMTIGELTEMIAGMDGPIGIKIKALKALRMNGNCPLEDSRPIIYDLVCDPITEKEAEDAETIEEWKNTFVYAENSPLDELDLSNQNKVIEYILREQIVRYSKPEKYLGMLEEFLEGEVM